METERIRIPTLPTTMEEMQQIPCPPAPAHATIVFLPCWALGASSCPIVARCQSRQQKNAPADCWTRLTEAVV